MSLKQSKLSFGVPKPKPKATEETTIVTPSVKPSTKNETQSESKKRAHGVKEDIGAEDDDEGIIVVPKRRRKLAIESDEENDEIEDSQQATDDIEVVAVAENDTEMSEVKETLSSQELYTEKVIQDTKKMQLGASELEKSKAVKATDAATVFATKVRSTSTPNKETANTTPVSKKTASAPSTTTTLTTSTKVKVTAKSSKGKEIGAEEGEGFKDDEEEDKHGDEVSDPVDHDREAKETKAAAAQWADAFSKSSKSPEEDAIWKKSEPVPYAALCKTFELIEATTKRLQILDYLVKFLIQVIKLSPESLLTVIYLSINKLCPEYEGLELGIGESLLLKAIAESTGRAMAKIKSDYGEIGDLGVVAMNSRSNQPTMFKPKPLTIPHVFKTLKGIASLKGNSSQSQKIDKIKVMLVSCQGKEAKYLMRSLEGKLRIGLAERTVVVALAHAIVLSRPDIKKLSKEKLTTELEEAATVVKSVYSELPCYDLIVPALLKGDIKGLREECKLTPGVPLKPMLAHPTKALTEILDRFENMAFTCEYKYDGERAQIHKLDDGRTMIYSRNSENMSAKYPDVMERLSKFAKPDDKTTSFVLDCEAVAWDREQECILPFQVLSTRKRKDVKEEDIKVQVCIFAFDLLYLNGESLLHEPLQKRRELMYEHFIEVEGQFAFAKAMNSTQIEDIQTFLDQSVVDNCEGLMVKTLDGAEATYEPSKRSRNWLKVKKDYLAGVGDSIDLVVIGAYIGRGKRTGVYGGFLLACYDPDREEYQSICKIGTGFSEADLEAHHAALKDHVIAEPKSYYLLGEGNKPDVWFAPVQVWEIKCADLSVSPVYKAAVGIVDNTKGISLRFPRFIRLRDDKTPENATASEQIAEMYNDQKLNSVKNDAGGGVDMDFDY